MKKLIAILVLILCIVGAAYAQRRFKYAGRFQGLYRAHERV